MPYFRQNCLTEWQKDFVCHREVVCGMVTSPSSRQRPWAQTLAPLLLAIQLSLSFLTCKTRIMVKPTSKSGVVFYGHATWRAPSVSALGWQWGWVSQWQAGWYPVHDLILGLEKTSSHRFSHSPQEAKSTHHSSPASRLGCHSRLGDYPVIHVLLMLIVSGGVTVLL